MQFFNEAVHMTIYKAQSPQQDWSLPGLIYAVCRPSNTPMVAAAISLCSLFNYILIMSPSIFMCLGFFALKHLILLVLRNMAGGSLAWPLGSSSSPTPDLTLYKPASCHKSSPLLFGLRTRPPAH